MEDEQKTKMVSAYSPKSGEGGGWRVEDGECAKQGGGALTVGGLWREEDRGRQWQGGPWGDKLPNQIIHSKIKCQVFLNSKLNHDLIVMQKASFLKANA